MRDPFDISQYKTSFNKNDAYAPNAFAFADFEDAFAFVANQIRMRQAAVRICFEVPEASFINVETYTLTTPSSLADAVELFQDAMRQLVQGTLIDTYGKLTGCNVYIGFFHFASNGLPIVGIGSIMTEGDFTPPPDPAVITDLVEFAVAIGERLNEIIFALNSMRFFHGPMKFLYPYNADCFFGSSSDQGTSSSGGGTSSSGGGTSSSGAGASSSGGGSSTSGAGTSSSGGGTSTSGGGTSSSGGGTSSSGATSSSAGGTSSSAGGTSSSAGGTSSSAGGTSSSGGVTSSSGGATSSSGGVTSSSAGGTSSSANDTSAGSTGGDTSPGSTGGTSVGGSTGGDTSSTGGGTSISVA